MNNAKMITGLAIAAAAAAMFVATPAAMAAKHEGKVHCTRRERLQRQERLQDGVECLQGHERLQGQGHERHVEKDCTAKGGKIESNRSVAHIRASREPGFLFPPLMTASNTQPAQPWLWPRPAC